MCGKMSRTKLSIILILIVFVCAGGFLFRKSLLPSEHEKNIEKYAKLIKREPNNCFYHEQLAANYQALHKFNKAIKHYEIAVKNCPENLISIFDIGICYYVTMRKQRGLDYMNEAIEEARKAKRKKLESMFIKSKSEWLEKWDSIKDLEWNKSG